MRSPKTIAGEQALYAAALRALARRAHSVFEMRAYLERRAAETERHETYSRGCASNDCSTMRATPLNLRDCARGRVRKGAIASHGSCRARRFRPTHRGRSRAGVRGNRRGRTATQNDRAADTFVAWAAGCAPGGVAVRVTAARGIRCRAYSPGIAGGCTGRRGQNG